MPADPPRPMRDEIDREALDWYYSGNNSGAVVPDLITHVRTATARAIAEEVDADADEDPGLAPGLRHAADIALSYAAAPDEPAHEQRPGSSSPSVVAGESGYSQRGRVGTEHRVSNAKDAGSSPAPGSTEQRRTGHSGLRWNKDKGQIETFDPHPQDPPMQTTPFDVDQRMRSLGVKTQPFGYTQEHRMFFEHEVRQLAREAVAADRKAREDENTSALRRAIDIGHENGKGDGFRSAVEACAKLAGEHEFFCEQQAKQAGETTEDARYWRASKHGARSVRTKIEALLPGPRAPEAPVYIQGPESNASASTAAPETLKAAPYTSPTPDPLVALERWLRASLDREARLGLDAANKLYCEARSDCEDDETESFHRDTLAEAITASLSAAAPPSPVSREEQYRALLEECVKESNLMSNRPLLLDRIRAALARKETQ